MLRTRVLAAGALALLLPAAAAAEETAALAAAAPAADMEIGPRVGLKLGFGGVTPGGLRAGGMILYRLSEGVWFDGEVAFSFGGGGAECYMTREADDPLACEHVLADGFGAQVAAGVRWFTAPRGRFRPYARLGLALAVATFGDDDVAGLALAPWLGGGLRVRMAERVTLGVEAAAQAGAGLYDRELGLEPYLALVAQVGVDFAF